MVKEGAVATHDFVLQNNSAKTLNIKDVTTSCGCTVSKISKKVLTPGESAAVAVKFDTKSYKGDVKQFVYVNTDSVEEPIVRFTIQANVLQQ